MPKHDPKPMDTKEYFWLPFIVNEIIYPLLRGFGPQDIRLSLTKSHPFRSLAFHSASASRLISDLAASKWFVVRGWDMSCKSIRYQGKNGQSAGKDESKGKLYAGKDAL